MVKKGKGRVIVTLTNKTLENLALLQSIYDLNKSAVVQILINDAIKRRKDNEGNF